MPHDWSSDPLASALMLVLLVPAAFASCTLRLLLHEAAHAVVGRACGFRVLGITIGAGRLLLRLRCGLGTFELRLLPRHGVVRAATGSARFFRLRMLAFLLAGPAMDLLFLAGLWAALVAVRAGGAADLLGTSLLLLFWLHAITSLSTLWVRRVAGLGVPSDLWQALGLLRLDRQAVASAVTVQRLNLAVHRAWRTFEAGDAATALRIWDDATPPLAEAIAVGRSVFVWACHGVDAALAASAVERQQLQAFASLARPAAAGARAERAWRRTIDSLQAYLDVNEAFFTVQADRPQLLPQADSLMQRALKILPRDPAVIRTLALVQLHRGDHARARSNLEWAWRQGEQDWLRALCACYLAYAHARGGDEGLAQRFLARARRLDPQCRLLAKYTALVAEAAAGGGA